MTSRTVSPRPARTRSTESVVSPSLGLVVLPRPWLSLYTTYAQGFEPPTPGQYLEDGRALTPAEHDSIEGGVKADLLDRRISVTGAGFRIRRTNVPEADALGFFRQIGEGESHGLELEVVGSVTRGLGLRGGYAWTSSRDHPRLERVCRPRAAECPPAQGRAVDALSRCGRPIEDVDGRRRCGPRRRPVHGSRQRGRGAGLHSPRWIGLVRTSGFPLHHRSRSRRILQTVVTSLPVPVPCSSPARLGGSSLN